MRLRLDAAELHLFGSFPHDIHTPVKPWSVRLMGKLQGRVRSDQNGARTRAGRANRYGIPSVKGQPREGESQPISAKISWELLEN